MTQDLSFLTPFNGFVGAGLVGLLLIREYLATSHLKMTQDLSFLTPFNGFVGAGLVGLLLIREYLAEPALTYARNKFRVWGNYS
jgi:hypothetical protein